VKKQSLKEIATEGAVILALAGLTTLGFVQSQKGFPPWMVPSFMKHSETPENRTYESKLIEEIKEPVTKQSEVIEEIAQSIEYLEDESLDLILKCLSGFIREGKPVRSPYPEDNYRGYHRGNFSQPRGLEKHDKGMEGAFVRVSERSLHLNYYSALSSDVAVWYDLDLDFVGDEIEIDINLEYNTSKYGSPLGGPSCTLEYDPEGKLVVKNLTKGINNVEDIDLKWVPSEAIENALNSTTAKYLSNLEAGRELHPRYKSLLENLKQTIIKHDAYLDKKGTE
jgi:hypothetical protein